MTIKSIEAYFHIYVFMIYIFKKFIPNKHDIYPDYHAFPIQTKMLNLRLIALINKKTKKKNQKKNKHAKICAD